MYRGLYYLAIWAGPAPLGLRNMLSPLLRLWMRSADALKKSEGKQVKSVEFKLISDRLVCTSVKAAKSHQDTLGGKKRHNSA